MPVQLSNFWPGGHPALIFCLFALKALDRKLKVNDWFTLSFDFVNIGDFLLRVVNVGLEIHKYATSCLQDFYVLLTERIYCKIRDFTAEDWLRPPLEM